MTKVARIENGSVVEIRDLNLDDIPPNKLSLWKQIKEEQDNPIYEKVGNPQYVFDKTKNQVNEIWSKKTISLGTVKTKKLAELTVMHQSLLNTSIVNVNVSDKPYTFGIDNSTTMFFVSIVALGLDKSHNITPKGMVDPIDVSLQDMKNITAAILSRRDEIHDVYMSGKKTILQHTKIEDVQKYIVKMDIKPIIPVYSVVMTDEQMASILTTDARNVD